MGLPPRPNDCPGPGFRQSIAHSGDIAALAFAQSASAGGTISTAIDVGPAHLGRIIVRERVAGQQPDREAVERTPYSSTDREKISWNPP